MPIAYKKEESADDILAQFMDLDAFEQGPGPDPENNRQVDTIKDKN